jgi:3-dehydroquinate synthetase
MLDPDDAQRQADLLRALHLPSSWPARADDILARIALDKKRAGDRQRWVLAERIGAALVRDDVPAALAREAVSSITLA